MNQKQAQSGLLSVLLAVAALSGAACRERGASPSDPFRSISGADFIQTHHANPELHLLDVRTPDEYTGDGHVPGAVLVPLQQLQQSGVASVPFAKEDEIYVICRSGRRSAAAATILASAGYKNVINVEGGTSGWIASGNPVAR